MKTGVQSVHNIMENTGFRLEFIPYLIRGRNDMKKNQINFFTPSLPHWGGEKVLEGFFKMCQITPQLCWGDEWPTLSPGWERVRVRGK
jgi:hypothetical protein